jgi:nicotinamide phosphoribosyltransferase
MNPLTTTDFYKVFHKKMFPDRTESVYSNLTARSSRLKNVPDSMFHGGVIFFGLQYFLKNTLIKTWNEQFFNVSRELAVGRYKRRLDNALGKDAVDVAHIGALHDLGYLPIRVRALPEGSLVPIGVPMLTIENTHKDFAWLTNYLETNLSNETWKPIVNATTAFAYRALMNKYAAMTGGDPNFVPFQGHDFSFRGMSGAVDGAISGVAHLLSFVGTDTIAAIDFAEEFYGANSDNELIGCSVFATEHSLMCAASACFAEVIADGEFSQYHRLITEVCPSGIVSIVSDTYDYWRVLTDYLPRLKDVITARNGKLVCRPDSGNPLHIICGNPDAPSGSPERKGSLELLWEVFGGTTNSKGYRELDPHIGLIYGDSITPSLCEQILQGMEAKGFCSTNVVFGIGSFTYQYVTRDTYGLAIKATHCVVNGKPIEIFKDPATDSGKMKKSLKGLVNVYKNADGVFYVKDQQPAIDARNWLQIVFDDGVLKRDLTLRDIRENVKVELAKVQSAA